MREGGREGGNGRNKLEYKTLHSNLYKLEREKKKKRATGTYIHTYVRTYIHTYIRTCMYMYACTYMYFQLNVELEFACLSG